MLVKSAPMESTKGAATIFIATSDAPAAAKRCDDVQDLQRKLTVLAGQAETPEQSRAVRIAQRRLARWEADEAHRLRKAFEDA